MIALRAAALIATGLAIAVPSGLDSCSIAPPEPVFATSQRPADTGAVLNGDGPWRAVDSDLDERAIRRAADAQVGQVEPQLRQPGPKGLDETLSEHEKKVRAELRPLQGRNVAGVPAVST